MQILNNQTIKQSNNQTIKQLILFFHKQYKDRTYIIV
jgi:hypothetical protein